MTSFLSREDEQKRDITPHNVRDRVWPFIRSDDGRDGGFGGPGLGDYDNAFAWLGKAIDEDTFGVFIMAPMFAHLRADPRFERIRRRLNGGGSTG
jgi:hypothetical protein